MAMRARSIGVVLTVCSVTLGAHAALVGWQARLRESWDRTSRVTMAEVVRQELSPLRADVDRAHARIDQLVLARKP